MNRRGRVAAAVLGGAVVATVSWLAVAPVETCLLHPSFPPQGACVSRLGTITALSPGESPTSFALLSGVAAGGLVRALVLGARWRWRAFVAAVAALVVGALAVPVVCEWVVPAGQLPRPAPELARRCTGIAGTTSLAASPQAAAVWSITTGLAVLTATWLRDSWRSRQASTAP